MRVCTHRSLGWAREPNSLDLVAPTLGLLTQVIKNDGSVNAETMEGGAARYHMRLRATLCLLKLAGAKAFDRAITPHFVDIAFMMQVSAYTTALG